LGATVEILAVRVEHGSVLFAYLYDHELEQVFLGVVFLDMMKRFFG
jgi:hypothetical protein